MKAGLLFVLVFMSLGSAYCAMPVEGEGPAAPVPSAAAAGEAVAEEVDKCPICLDPDGCSRGYTQDFVRTRFS